MKVYVLTEHNYNRECGEEFDSWILGVFDNEEKAKEEMRKVMQNDIEDETENIVFYRITESEVE